MNAGHQDKDTCIPPLLIPAESFNKQLMHMYAATVISRLYFALLTLKDDVRTWGLAVALC